MQQALQQAEQALQQAEQLAGQQAEPQAEQQAEQQALAEVQVQGSVWKKLCNRMWTSSSRDWVAAAFAEQRPTENTVSVDTALTMNWQLHVVGSLKCPEG